MSKQSSRQDKHGLLVVVKVFPFALSTVWQAGPSLLTLLALTTILSGLAPMATVCVGKYVLDSIVSAVKAGWGSAEVITVYQWLALQLFILLGIVLIERGNSFLIHIIGKRLSLNMSKKVLEKTSSLDLAAFEDSEFYDKITRARLESRGRALNLVIKFNSVICGGITFFSMGSLIASLSLTLFMVMMLVCLPLLLVLVKYTEKLYQMQYIRTEETRKTNYLSTIMTTKRYIPEIINLGLWSYLRQKWFNFSLKFFHQDIRLVRRQNIAQSGVNAIMTASEVGATGYIFFLGVKILSLSVGEIIMYSSAFSQGLHGLRRGVESISGIYEDVLFFNNLMEFHKLEPSIKIKKMTKAVPEDIESIEVQNVSFRYPGTRRDVLKNINISFKKSESILLVGGNGAGKTTLIKLLMRLYDPDEGRILINGVDIRELDIQSLHQIIGMIFQDYVRFAVSVKENIGYGFINEIENQNRIIKAAKVARADTLINALPHGYDTILSRLFRNGQELSQGQWQRICLARLFMKNSPILIFDEPTASLDIETEVSLLHEIERLSRNKICILVSHHMFRHSITDRIVILDKGEIVETGTYESLIAHNGEFARLRRLYYNMTKEHTDNLAEQKMGATL